ncbi:hypothetical protein BH09BAC6_BH09BAC6_32810 [soil metagenome]
MVVLFIVVLLTIVLMQNTEPVKFTVLFADFYISKLVMMTFVSIVGFILGVLVARPKKVRFVSGTDPANKDMKETPDTRSISNEDYID